MSLLSATRRPLTFPGSAVQFTPLHVIVLALAAGLAWAWSADRAMGSMPGTMGRGGVSFVVMWTLMMAAMMIPSAAPFASMHARTFDRHRVVRLIVFSAGYMLVWAASGVPAYGLAVLVDEFVIAAPDIGMLMAVAIFAACGVYQLTPLKNACLSHCRSPLGHVLHYASFTGVTRDLRVGVHHGAFCLACCWSLMALMAAYGFMNLWAMVGLAAVVAIEKYWVRGEWFARAVGVTALVCAVAVVWVPELAPGLDGSGMRMMSDMAMGMG
jgi:predicted metal-binding membrane protein